MDLGMEAMEQRRWLGKSGLPHQPKVPIPVQFRDKRWDPKPLHNEVSSSHVRIYYGNLHKRDAMKSDNNLNNSSEE
eukprot:1392863-Amorphochlora_amoeboformis.AAC.1